MVAESKIVNNNLIEIQLLLPSLVYLGHSIIILGLKILRNTVDNVFVPCVAGAEVVASFLYKEFLSMYLFSCF